MGIGKLVTPSFSEIVIGFYAPDGCDGAPPDRDCDGTEDPVDLCPDYRSSNNEDSDGNGIGDICECGDQTGDGFVDVQDVLAINAAIFDPSLATPLCDTNDDDTCDVHDLLGANAKIFGAEAYCARYPSP